MALVDLQISLVLAHVSNVMTLRKHAPHIWPKPESVRQQLKHNVAMCRSITLPAKCGQAQRLGSALSGLFTPQRFSNAEGILASDQPNLGLRQRAGYEGAVCLRTLR